MAVFKINLIRSLCVQACRQTGGLSNPSPLYPIPLTMHLLQTPLPSLPMHSLVSTRSDSNTAPPGPSKLALDPLHMEEESLDVEGEGREEAEGGAISSDLCRMNPLGGRGRWEKDGGDGRLSGGVGRLWLKCTMLCVVSCGICGWWVEAIGMALGWSSWCCWCW